MLVAGDKGETAAKVDTPFELRSPFQSDLTPVNLGKRYSCKKGGEIVKSAVASY
jgi:hypothetical protein